MKNNEHPSKAMSQDPTKNGERLSKVMARAGVASRRACEELIFKGSVRVNGVLTKTPQTHVSPEDKIMVHGKRIGNEESKVYYMVNKPEGYLCSTEGGSPGKRILALFGEESRRLFTVGRLDRDTSGLILVTNDGHFANKVIHPSSNVIKEYLVKTNKEITDEHLKIISKGAVIDGIMVLPKKVSKVRKGTLKIAISEGKKHEVRIMVARANLEIHELIRIRIGGLHLGDLPKGAWRSLTDNEKAGIFE